jgi:argininosuccinate lyase
LTVNSAILAQRAHQSYSGATDLAESMMLTAGFDTHTAHRIVGQAVRMAAPTNQPFTPELLDQAAQNVIGRSLNLSAKQIATATDPWAIVQTRSGSGGAAPLAVQAMIATYRTAAAEGVAWQLAQENRIAAAITQLLAQAQTLAKQKR